MKELREKRPAVGTGWATAPLQKGDYLRGSAWLNGKTLVMSTLVNLKDANGEILVWLLAVSHIGRMPKPNDVRRALRAFGMTGAEEFPTTANTRRFVLEVPRLVT